MTSPGLKLWVTSLNEEDPVATGQGHRLGGEEQESGFDCSSMGGWCG